MEPFLTCQYLIWFPRGVKSYKRSASKVTLEIRDLSLATYTSLYINSDTSPTWVGYGP